MPGKSTKAIDKKIEPEIVEELPLLRPRVNAYMATAVEGYDWENSNDSPGDLFRQTINSEPIKRTEKYYACGSIRVNTAEDIAKEAELYNRLGIKQDAAIAASTPDALYRLLYLIRPSEVDFSDMYKTCLFTFRSVDKRFMVAVQLFKYEVGLYFYCRKEYVGGKGSGVIAGMPGSDNGWNCTDPDGIAFFEMIKKAVGNKWMVYDGNNFEV